MTTWRSLLDTNITPEDVMYVILAVLAVSCIRWLWKQNQSRQSTIDLADLITVGGRLNERKVTRFGAWIVSTWGFVYLIVAGKLTEWYFVGYMTAWVANALIGKAIKDPNGEEYPTPKTPTYPPYNVPPPPRPPVYPPDSTI